MQWIGIAVRKKPSAVKPGLKVTDIEAENPLAGNPEAIAAGMELYEEHCAMCHGDNGEGDIGPSLVDNTVLKVEGDLSDAHYFGIISNGLEEGMEVAGRSVEGGMPEFREDLSKKEIWSTVSYIRSLQGK
jgi:mono/diheme cytochrome c family protein